MSSRDKKQLRHRLSRGFVIGVLSVLVLSTVGLAVFSVAQATVPSDNWASVFGGLSVVAGVFAGSSATVMFIEYFASEELVQPIVQEVDELRDSQEQLTIEVDKLIDLVRVERESGYRRHYTDRRQAFVAIYQAVKNARRRAWFLGISNSIFEDLRNLQNMIGEDDPIGRFHEALISCMQKDCHVQFLYLARAKTQLYLARDETETGGRPENVNDCQLFQDTLVSLNRHTLRLYCEAARQEVEDKVDIREYSLVPTVSVIIIDDRMFVGPYAARKCKDIPVQEYTLEAKPTDREVLRDSQLYFEHYVRYATDTGSVLTTPNGRLSAEARKRVLNGDACARQRMEQWDGQQQGPYEEMIDEVNTWLGQYPAGTAREGVG
jgi:hypothetical protein